MGSERCERGPAVKPKPPKYPLEIPTIYLCGLVDYLTPYEAQMREEDEDAWLSYRSAKAWLHEQRKYGPVCDDCAKLLATDEERANAED